MSKHEWQHDISLQARIKSNSINENKNKALTHKQNLKQY